MVIAIWMCLLINIVTAIFLLITSMSSDQDAAGRGMVMLPIILLLGLAALSYFLLQRHYLGWSLFTSGLPVIVILYLLFISVT